MTNSLRISSFIRKPKIGPRLLVSVRSAAEAVLAINAGADILDVKEPSLGSLGMADSSVIQEIASQHQVKSGQIPFSAALGELVDNPTPHTVPPLSLDCLYAKMGLSQCVGKSEWVSDWLKLRSEFEQRISASIRWVAVAYADADAAGSPDLFSVMKVAVQTGCAGVLIDTWSKDQRTTLDWISIRTMHQVADECHSSGLFLAMAGKLTSASLDTLAEVPADIIAIRSAGCVGNDRQAKLDHDRIALFKQKMNSCFEVAECDRIA